MPLILAIEPDRRQASQLAALVRIRLDAELLVADSIKRAVTMLRSRLPDLILVSPLLSASDEAALAARLSHVDRDATHVRMLHIPALAGEAGSSTTPLRRRRTGSKSPGCDPSIFAAKIADQLDRAAAERALGLTAAESRDEAPAQVAAAVPEPIEEIPTPVESEEDERTAAAPADAAVTVRAAEAVAVADPSEIDEIDEARDVVEVAAPPVSAALVVLARDDPQELWSALAADDSRAWPPLEGIGIRSRTFAPLDRVEVWEPLASGVHTWPPLEGLPAAETMRLRSTTAAAAHDDLVKLVADLRREIKALRLLHAAPPSPPYDPVQYVVPAFVAGLDASHDLPDDSPAADRPS